MAEELTLVAMNPRKRSPGLGMHQHLNACLAGLLLGAGVCLRAPISGPGRSDNWDSAGKRWRSTDQVMKASSWANALPPVPAGGRLSPDQAGGAARAQAATRSKAPWSGSSR